MYGTCVNYAAWISIRRSEFRFSRGVAAWITSIAATSTAHFQCYSMGTGVRISYAMTDYSRRRLKRPATIATTLAMLKTAELAPENAVVPTVCTPSYDMAPVSVKCEAGA